jgi:hypothetical protein
MVALIGVGAAGGLAAWAWAGIQSRRRRSPAELERLRRLEVHRRGRIAAGRVVDLVEPNPPQPTARLILYKYEVAGVTYEAAQDVSALPEVVGRLRCLAGQSASIKYDPQKPTNSIIACEEWCGIKEIESLSH